MLFLYLLTLLLKHFFLSIKISLKTFFSGYIDPIIKDLSYFYNYSSGRGL